MTTEHTATLLSGVPSINKAVFHAIRFDAHDPASIIVTPHGNRRLVLRDVEVARAKKLARADEVFSYEDFEPKAGLSGDREIRAAQATAECLRQMDITQVTVDRTASALIIDELPSLAFTPSLPPISTHDSASSSGWSSQLSHLVVCAFDCLQSSSLVACVDHDKFTCFAS